MENNKLPPHQQAIIDFMEAWGIANASPFVRKPISNALYHTWKIWDKKETTKEEGLEDERY